MKGKHGLPDPTMEMSEWYQAVIARAELAESSLVKGCAVIRPYGYAIWELIQAMFDARFKKRGVDNAYFPLLIPQSLLAREKEHIAGFSPEFAVVTHAGGAELAEPLVVRPTSEVIIHESMAKWISSHRDLPMRLNVWGNVVRWEMRPRLFLRGTEFLWQEGHTAHRDEAEARQEVDAMVGLYHDVVANQLAIPTVMGVKSDDERFAGAVESHSIEGMMPDGKGLQMGTVHYLGERFSRMAGVTFLDRDGSKRYVHMTSWGVSTRLIGALIMVHGDQRGLVLPPAVAPIQVVIVPISQSKDGEGAVSQTVSKVAEALREKGVRVKVDDREDVKPGAKFYEHDLRGVPLRIDIGPRDIAAGTLTFTWRKGWEREVMPIDHLSRVPQLLAEYQSALLGWAKERGARQMVEPIDRGDFVDALTQQRGFIRAPWCGSLRCSNEIKSITKATIRNLPYDGRQEKKENCIWCGTQGMFTALFAKSY